MATPDVRVRLSAEGAQEVVEAFKRVQNQANKTKDSAKSVGLLNEALGNLKGVVLGIGLVQYVSRIAGMVAANIEAADSIGDVAAATGAATETLSVLALVAKGAGVEQSVLDKGFIKFTKTLDGLRNGEQGAVDLFERIGLSAKDLEGLDPGQAFVKVSQRMAQFEGGAGKVAVTTGLMGKGSTDLIEVMDKLGNDGFDQARKKAEKLGLIIGDDLTEAAGKAKEAMADLNNQVQAASLQFTTGFLPEFLAGINALNAGLGKGGDGAKSFGAVFGFIFKSIAQIASSSMATAGGAIAFFFSKVQGFYERSKALVTGGLGALEQADKIAQARSDAILANIKRDFKDIFNPQTAPETKPPKPDDGPPDDKPPKPPIPPKPPKPPVADKGQVQAAAKARLDLQRQLLDNEQKLKESYSKLEEERNKTAFENGLISLQEYYDKRRELETKALDQEIATLEAKKKAIVNQPAAKSGSEELTRKKEVLALEGQIQQKQAERVLTIRQLNQEETKAAQSLSQERLQIEQKLLEAQGNRHQAALLALDEEIRKTEELLRKQGASPQDVARITGEQRSQGTANIQVDALQEQASQALQQLDADRQAIQNSVATGQTLALVGEQQIVALEQQRLPMLQAIAQQMLTIAQASGNPQLITQAQQLNQQIGQLTVGVDKAGQAMANLKNGLTGALESSVTNFFTDGIVGAESMKAAFLDFAGSTVQALQRVVVQQLAVLAVQQLIAALGGGAVAGAVSAGAGLVAETGGYLYGPSHATGGIPLEAEGGEFIVRKSVVSQPGILNLLHTLNRGRLPSIAPISRVPKFATGGLVGGGAGAGTSNLNSSLTVGLEQGLMLKELKTPEGQRVIVNALLQHRNAVNQILR